MLNVALDRHALAAEFAKDGRVRVENVLEPDVAERIREYCVSEVPFDVVYVLDGMPAVAPAGRIAALDQGAQQAMQAKLYDAASKGVGYLYRGYMMGAENRERGNEKMQFLHDVFRYVNGPEMIGFVNEVSGRDDLLSAAGQYTMYTPGHYLTRHRDSDMGHGRVLAFVFGFSKDWHPDWGGLLQFYQDDGTPRDAWTPRFNSLVLFEIRHVHAVTYVTPFAPAPRVSMTGWFRTRPGEFGAAF